MRRLGVKTIYKIIGYNQSNTFTRTKKKENREKKKHIPELDNSH